MPRAERARLQYYEKHHPGTIINLVKSIDWIGAPSQLCPALQINSKIFGLRSLACLLARIFSVPLAV
eukprot:3841076-Alexandrium_andersonii.AAC.1